MPSGEILVNVKADFLEMSNLLWISDYDDLKDKGPMNDPILTSQKEELRIEMEKGALVNFNNKWDIPYPFSLVQIHLCLKDVESSIN